MKKTFVTILIVIAILVACYVGLFSIHRAGPKDIGVVKDLRTGTVVETFRRPWNFVWHGIMPWWYQVYRIPVERHGEFEIIVPITNLKNLTNENYLIRIPIHAEYAIDKSTFTQINLLSRSGDTIEGLVRNQITGSFTRELYDFFDPLYQRERVYREKDEIIIRVHESAKDLLKSYGLILESIRYTNVIILPDMATYAEGLRHSQELMRLDNRNEIILRELKGELERNRMENRRMYDKLTEISRIISKNPAVLKYIYIDKLSPNVKVILSSDRTGVPGFLEEKIDEDIQQNAGEIDNLR